MSVALKLYEQLTDAGEDKQRAHLIAEAFEQIEERYPEIKDLATHGHVRESELRLLKEIKETEGRLKIEIKELENRFQIEIKELEGRLQKEIKELESRLQKEIKELEGRLQKEIKELEGRLQKEIKELGKEVKVLEKEIKELEIRMVSAMHRQTLWIIGSVGAIIGAFRVLDLFLHTGISGH